jgi:hypothetical protein
MRIDVDGERYSKFGLHFFYEDNINTFHIFLYFGNENMITENIEKLKN